jgi:acyl-CoA thioesterase-1
VRGAGAPRLPLALAALLASACAGGPPESLKPEALPAPFTYVAVGASETVGIGADDPLTQSWPSVFHRTGLARSATLVNVGVSGATVQEALALELQPALAEEPRLVTVWLNVNDLVRQLPVARYERDLGTLVRALRRGGATDVLVASTPPVVDLPVVRACLPDGFHPSTEGHRRVAAAFADALASLPSAAELRPPPGRPSAD